MGKSKSVSRSPSYARAAFSGVLGGVAAMAMVGFVCFILFAIGYNLIIAYNKPGTKTFEEIQPMQYLGIFICFLALIPFIQYFFIGLLFSAGEEAFKGFTE